MVVIVLQGLIESILLGVEPAALVFGDELGAKRLEDGAVVVRPWRFYRVGLTP